MLLLKLIMDAKSEKIWRLQLLWRLVDVSIQTQFAAKQKQSKGLVVMSQVQTSFRQWWKALESMERQIPTWVTVTTKWLQPQYHSSLIVTSVKRVDTRQRTAPRVTRSNVNTAVDWDTRKQHAWCKLPRNVLYKCTYVPYNGTFGASDQGQMLNVWGWHPADVNAEVAATPDVTTSLRKDTLNITRYLCRNQCRSIRSYGLDLRMDPVQWLLCILIPI